MKVAVCVIRSHYIMSHAFLIDNICLSAVRLFHTETYTLLILVLSYTPCTIKVSYPLFIIWGCMFSVYPIPSWWLREYIALSYYHHQIGSMNYYPLFRVSSWNNGMRCMSLYILMGAELCTKSNTLTSPNPQVGITNLWSLSLDPRLWKAYVHKTYVRSGNNMGLWSRHGPIFYVEWGVVFIQMVYFITKH